MQFDINDVKSMAKILDKIINSENPEIKNSFRELCVMVTLLDEPIKQGVFTKLFDRIEEIEYEIRNIKGRESERYDRRYGDPWRRHYGTTASKPDFDFFRKMIERDDDVKWK